MHMGESIPIIKKSGERDLFNPEKLRRSLERSGAGPEDIEFITNTILGNLKPGMRTNDIYRQAYRLLHNRSHHAASRYRLKDAIFELGPTGYPFEKFVGALLSYQGYKVETGVIVDGLCVQHEVDVVAERNDETIMVECKFHSDQGRKSDVKIPLYIHSRFEDIHKRLEKESGHPAHFKGWLVTNSKFTGDAVIFGKCAGLTMISWDYPADGSLKQRIDLSGLFPVTCLHTISRKEKKALLDKDIVLCREIHNHPDRLQETTIPPSKHSKILSEIHNLFINL
jgi:hypothetical protein